MDLLTITDIPKDIAKNAVVNLSVKDFEDAVQFELAISSGSDFFITRNLKDFPISAPFVICDAETYLNKYSLNE